MMQPCIWLHNKLLYACLCIYIFASPCMMHIKMHGINEIRQQFFECIYGINERHACMHVINEVKLKRKKSMHTDNHLQKRQRDKSQMRSNK